MIHIKERLKQYADKYSDCYKYAGVYVKVIQDMIEQLLADLEQDEKENGWIPVKYHQISEKEHAEESISKDIHYMLDCKMPDDEQEILVTNGKTTWQDMCRIDSDGYYLDNNYDWIEITAWRPIPEPYKEDRS